ncbi:MAG TPA: prolyl oligopeptidase family serine peptidase [Candidatus Dormibacteraeota bacterium]
MVAIIAGCSQASPTSPKAAARTLTGAIGAAAYDIEVPSAWNGTLFLYSHGYVPPGGPQFAAASPSVDATAWLLAHHFAAAGSSYSSTGWALPDAFTDQVALLDHFEQYVGKPKRVIAWGTSLGGMITAGLVQLYPDRFAAAMPMCGVLSGGIATWNLELDAAYAFRTLLAPGSGLQLTHISDPIANLRLALDTFNQAAASPAGRARIALVAALIDLPGWFDPRSPEPAAGDFVAREEAQAMWESRVDFSFAFRYRADLELRAGGNPSWNTGVDYSHQLSISADRDEVNALYGAAGLDLQADLRTLNAGARVTADPSAVAYLDRNVSFDGRLSIPVLTMHTSGDGLVVPPNEGAYADVVNAAGQSALLRQTFVHRAGHCAFTEAETVAALQVLLKRLDTGRWDEAALQPAALNAAALAQGDLENVFFGAATPPAFVDFSPTQYPRPFAKGAPNPT